MNIDEKVQPPVDCEIATKYTGPSSAVSNVSDNRCKSVCRSTWVKVAKSEKPEIRPGVEGAA